MHPVALPIVLGSVQPDPSSLPELLRHLESLYTLAQVLTLDAEEAARLVENTYLAAIEVGPDESVDRSWLFARLHTLHEERQRAYPSAPDALVPIAESTSLFAPQQNLRQRLVDPFLRHAAPIGFASLDARDRLILTLCEVERLSCADAARVSGEPPEETCRRLDFARSAFHLAVVSQATPMIRDLLQTFDASEWVPAALRRAVKSEFGSMPATLEPTVHAALNATTVPEALAVERLPSAETPRTGFLGRMKRALAPAALVVGAGLVGIHGSRLLNRPADPNVVSLAVAASDRVRLMEEIESTDTAERFFYERLNWRLDVPAIDQAPLAGAGLTEFAEDAFVPTMLYTSPDGSDRVVVYAFSYALLDRFTDRLFLERQILAAIADDRHFDVYRLTDSHNVVIWRQADDIYLAVTAGDPEALRDRIQVL